MFLTTPVGFATSLSKGTAAAADLVLGWAPFVFGLAGALRFGGALLVVPLFLFVLAVFFPLGASSPATLPPSPLLDVDGVGSGDVAAVVVPADEGHGISSTRS